MLPFPTLPSFLATLLILSLLPYAHAKNTLPEPPSHDHFIAFLQSLEEEFLSQGVSSNTFNRFIQQVKYRKGVIESDRNQPESTFSPQKYLTYLVSSQRIKKGQEKLKTHLPLIQKISHEFGVPPHVLVAFWGIESFYGTYVGKVPLANALATLTFDTRRRNFFKKQLLSFLTLQTEGSLPHTQVQGSWAGAMGHMQFIPSSYHQFAVDYDGDNKRDLWHSLPDIFASAAHYLQKVGWKKDQRWGRPVSLPPQFNPKKYNQPLSVSQWKEKGLTLWNGKPLPASHIKASLVFFDHNTPAFITYHNYNVIMRWNRSKLYALAVGLLSDHIASRHTPSDFSKPFSP